MAMRPLEILRALLNPPAATVEDCDRKRLFTIYLLLLILPLIIFGTDQIRTGHLDYGIIDYCLAAVLTFFIGLLRRLKNGRGVFRITLALLVSLLTYWLVTGAVDGYASVWVLSFPPFAFFLMGRREGFAWTAIMSLITLVVFVNPGSAVTCFAYPPTLATRHIFALFIIILFTYNYEAVRERFKNAMEGEQANLHAEKERLALASGDLEAVNRRLADEIAIRRHAEEELRAHRDRLEELVGERTLQLKSNVDKLAASEARYRLLAENVTDLIWTMDLELHFTFMTPSVTSMFGFSVEEAMALPIERWSTPESNERAMREYLTHLELEKSGSADPTRFAVFQVEQFKKDGSTLWVEIKTSFLRNTSGRAIGFVGVTRDISERVQAQRETEKIQEQLAQAQKMEALGTLVGGLAHDFNNILIGIMGSYDLLGMLLENNCLRDKDEIDQYLRLGADSARRAADLIKQLLALSKKHGIALTPVDITESLRHIRDICRNSFPKSVALDFRIAERPLVVMGDMVQIEQVLLNLCINASHAMTVMRDPSERQGGVLTVEADEIGPEADGGRGRIRIQISDTGVGMDAETRQRIFEPYFSKKERHDGSGLGLTISYNIVHSHGGRIIVYSEPGAGSRFTLYLPAHEAAIVPTGGEIAQDIVRGSGTVLVIDDEPSVLATARGFLERCGYEVLTAESAEGGIALFRETHGRVSAVLIDLSMPVKSGLEVFRELREIDPSVRALLSSGMLDAESKNIALALGIREFVNKPYLARELSHKIHAVIG